MKKVCYFPTENLDSLIEGQFVKIFKYTTNITNKSVILFINDFEIVLTKPVPIDLNKISRKYFSAHYLKSIIMEPPIITSDLITIRFKDPSFQPNNLNIGTANTALFHGSSLRSIKTIKQW